MPNQLNAAPDYLFTHTPHGVSRRYLYENGTMFSEWTSHRTLVGRPLVQIANGRCPETGKMAVARGFVAIGQRSKGVVAIGQFASGAVAIGQFSVGVLAIGQFSLGLVAIGEFAAGIAAAGQTAAGILAGAGQVATGYFVFAQWGLGVLGRVSSGWGAASLHIVKHLFR